MSNVQCYAKMPNLRAGRKFLFLERQYYSCQCNCYCISCTLRHTRSQYSSVFLLLCDFLACVVYVIMVYLVSVTIAVRRLSEVPSLPRPLTAERSRLCYVGQRAKF